MLVKGLIDNNRMPFLILNPSLGHEPCRSFASKPGEKVMAHPRVDPILPRCVDQFAHSQNDLIKIRID
jgi:hypothetical protein